ncbi:hypothetical protein CNMCM5623_008978 [Aspergillus felis]|uniref:Uncharacterized protein n=1 Tax=Aspergillus felis TaxID=1287682 RepID=A0A8H6QMP9_9EURO|nr:hypothetical protein CNMCM5623_008978 [Aspergillus felis]
MSNPFAAKFFSMARVSSPYAWLVSLRSAQQALRQTFPQPVFESSVPEPREVAVGVVWGVEVEFPLLDLAPGPYVEAGVEGSEFGGDGGVESGVGVA